MSILGMATNLITGGAYESWQDARQLAQQGKLNQQAEDSQNRLSDRAAERQLAMWKATNYAAQREEMEKAGLSVGLMYGQGGGGGTTVGQNSAQGMSAGKAGDPNAAVANGITLGMQAAQMEVLKSQAEKNRAEAAQIQGADTDLKQAQGVNQQAQAALAGAETALKNVLTKYQNESLEWQLDKVAQEANIALGQAQSALAKGNVDSVTVDSQINTIRQTALNTALQAIVMKQGISLDKAKMEEITNGIQQKWKELNINETKSRYEHADRIKAIEDYTTNALKVAGIYAAGQVVGDIVKIATRQAPTGSVTTTTNKNGDIIRENWTRPLK